MKTEGPLTREKFREGVFSRDSHTCVFCSEPGEEGRPGNNKKWERLVFFGINQDEKDCRLFWFTKDDFLAHLESDDCLFASQQGGKSIGNDDYICTKVDRLLECSFVKSVTEW